MSYVGSKEKGKLYLVPTPIGNEQDMSPRALAVLAEADLIACEDTRVTAGFLADRGLPFKELISYHEHNEQARSEVILNFLQEGKSVALVSDAGMPAISDPGEILVKKSLEHGIKVCALPGPNAAVTALAASGLSTRYFHFEGFIPAAGKERKDRLVYLADLAPTIIIYEAPHRLVKSLKDLGEAGLLRRKICLARELSKRYESYLYLTLEEALSYYTKEKPRGEYVLVLEGRDEFFTRLPEALAEEREQKMAALRKEAKSLLDEGLSPRSVLSLLQKYYNLPKNDLYREIRSLSSSYSASGAN